MKILNVQIQSSGMGHSIGKITNGKFVYIKNGDLLNMPYTRCIETGTENDKILAEIIETYENDKVIQKQYDGEGLIDTKLITVLNSQIYQIENKWFFPDKRINTLLTFLINKPGLWEKSKVKLVSKRSSNSRLISFGISFKSALKKIETSGFSKARLYCEDKQRFTKEGVIAEMLASSYLDKNGNLTLEIWQGVEGVHEVFYSHGIMNNKMNSFTHFDCAIINLNIADKSNLFNLNKKIKSGAYNKLFRIDGIIKNECIFEIANKFFPLDNLIDEYFEIERI